MLSVSSSMPYWLFAFHFCTGHAVITIFLLMYDVDTQTVSKESNSQPEENNCNGGQCIKKRFILEEVTARYDVLRQEFLSRGWLEQKRHQSYFDFKWTWS